jgi:DNA-binding CsgD family transcriptional regulator
VGEKLGTSYKTVEKQIASARKKLGANNNEQAIAKALTLGVIEL